MRFMAIMYPGPRAEAGEMPDEATLAAMGAFNEELVGRGALLGGEGLHPSARGARLRFAGGAAEVTRGPFAGEVVGGYWMLEFPSLEEALAVMARCPAAEGQTIELRQVYTADDFGEALTPELREQEDRMRARIEGRTGEEG